MNVTERLDEIEGRANAATEGPWTVEDHSNHCNPPSWVIPDIERERHGYTNPVFLGDDQATATFIAAARSDVPVLVAALRAVLALHAKVETPRHGCCARPRLCDGHAPECSAREHGVSKPPWPCPTVRAIATALVG